MFPRLAKRLFRSSLVASRPDFLFTCCWSVRTLEAPEQQSRTAPRPFRRLPSDTQPGSDSRPEPFAGSSPSAGPERRSAPYFLFQHQRKPFLLPCKQKRRRSGPSPFVVSFSCAFRLAALKGGARRLVVVAKMHAGGVAGGSALDGFCS